LAQGLPDTKVGTFTPALYAEAKKKNWTVISIKNYWKKISSSFGLCKSCYGTFKICQLRRAMSELFAHTEFFSV
jgi:hypothetical protein